MATDQRLPILAINPGAQSTKLGVFAGDSEQWSTTLIHPERDLSGFDRVTDQLAYRMNLILQELNRAGIEITGGSLAAVVGRGGLMRPVPGGVYSVCDRMLADLAAGVQGEHASNLGAGLARAVADRARCPAFVVDPVAVDELEPPARLSGHRDIPRRSLSHALNSKAVARTVAEQMGRTYQECNFIVVHLGSGFSVGAHRRGRIIDVNNANEEGPFSAERTGGLPIPGVVRLTAQLLGQGLSERQVIRKFTREGGLMSYLGTRSGVEVAARIEAGDREALQVVDAMIYQVAREIGAMATVLQGDIDAILITGGMARWQLVTAGLCDRVQFLARCIVVPGEQELSALAAGARRALLGKERVLSYELEAE